MMDGDVGTVRCPDCGVYISCTKENKDIRLAEHIQSGCKMHSKKSKKIKCNFKGCKARLEKYQCFKCRDCKHVFCVKHRANHKCGNSSALRSNQIVKDMRKKQLEVSRSGVKLFGSAVRSLPAWKQQKVAEMVSLLQCTNERALACLNRGRWNLDRATSYYFDS